MLIVLSVTACKRQDKDTSKNSKPQKEAKSYDTQDEPKGQWEVHKEMDENGNIISYDSIYYWSSTGDYPNMSHMNMDSLLRSHQAFIRRRFSAIKNQNFPYLFQEDSLFSKGFFEEDLFMNQFGKDFPEMDELNKRMERMRQEMLREFFPKENSKVKSKEYYN